MLESSQDNSRLDAGSARDLTNLDNIIKYQFQKHQVEICTHSKNFFELMPHYQLAQYNLTSRMKRKGKAASASIDDKLRGPHIFSSNPEHNLCDNKSVQEFKMKQKKYETVAKALMNQQIYRPYLHVPEFLESKRRGRFAG